MSDTPAEPAADTPPAEGAPPASSAPAADPGKAPKWDGEFDADRAARLVENLRADVKKRDDEIATLKAASERGAASSKSAEERLAALEARAEKAEHDLLVATAAKKHGIPDDLVGFLTAKAPEDLDTQAEALARYAKKPADDVPGKPKPALKPGAGADSAPEPFDAAKVAAAIRRR